MFGRYSLDTEGLAYAGGEWGETKNKKPKQNEPTSRKGFNLKLVGSLVFILVVLTFLHTKGVPKIIIG